MLTSSVAQTLAWRDRPLEGGSGEASPLLSPSRDYRLASKNIIDKRI